MANMRASSLAEMQWVDIIPPEAAATSLDVAHFALTLAVVALVVAAPYFYFNRPKQQARRKMLALIRRNDQDGDRRRDDCHLIAQELGKAFGNRRLSSIEFTGEQQENWQVFVQNLEEVRFSPQSPSADDLKQLASQAINWLRLR